MRFFRVFIFTLTLSSCISYKIERYKVNDVGFLNKKIPKLDLRVVEGNFETFYAGRVAKLCKNQEDYIPEDIIDNSLWPTDTKRVQEFDFVTKNYSFGYMDTYHKKNKWHDYELLVTETKEPKYLSFFRIEDGYLGKQESFQRYLTQENSVVPVCEIPNRDTTKYMVDYLGKLKTSCLTDFNEGSILYYHYQSKNINNFIGASNVKQYYTGGTLPELIDDIKGIYQYEMEQNICTSGSSKGYCVLKLLSDSVNTNTGIWSEYKTVFFFYTGLPLIKYERTMKIELEIFSLDNKKVACYNATGYSKKFSAMYWGYSAAGQVHPNNNKPLCRASNSSAFYDAFQKIKNDIVNDSDEIINGLYFPCSP